MSSTLQEEVLKELNSFFEKEIEDGKLFFNERELQMYLACFFSKKGYIVKLEYKIASSFLKDKLKVDDGKWEVLFPWKEKVLSIDIAISKNKDKVEGKEWLPIELKYKTKDTKLSPDKHTRFDEDYGEKYAIIKNQAAQDLGRYGFWKDVRRLEIVTSAFKNVVGGIAIFLTNDENYVYCPKYTEGKLSQYRDFAMNCSERKAGKMAWRHIENDEIYDKKDNKWKGYPNFNISNSYKIECKDLNKNNYYCWILPVPKTEIL